MHHLFSTTVPQVHNTVNLRLVQEELVDGATNLYKYDPAFPKAAWPPVSLCPECHGAAAPAGCGPPPVRINFPAFPCVITAFPSLPSQCLLLFRVFSLPFLLFSLRFTTFLCFSRRLRPTAAPAGRQVGDTKALPFAARHCLSPCAFHCRSPLRHCLVLRCSQGSGSHHMAGTSLRRWPGSRATTAGKTRPAARAVAPPGQSVRQRLCLACYRCLCGVAFALRFHCLRGLDSAFACGLSGGGGCASETIGGQIAVVNSAWSVRNNILPSRGCRCVSTV